MAALPYHAKRKDGMKMYVAGMDMGSYMSKLLILDQDGKEMVREKENSGVLYGDTAKKLLERGCAKLGIRPEELGRVVLTGIGSKSVDQDAKVLTDVTCQSTACRKLVPGCHTVVDVGGSLTKVIRLDPDGHVAQFVFSEKCAAGSGRFMQVIARILEIDVEEIGPLSMKGTEPITFSTGCAVFAESDVITKIGEGETKENILAGMNLAVSGKIVNLVKRVGYAPECVITGGAAQNQGLVAAVSDRLQDRVSQAPEPQFSCAYGAALIALEELHGSEADGEKAVCGKRDSDGKMNDTTGGGEL